MYIIIHSNNDDRDVLGILDESTVRDPTDMTIESYSYSKFSRTGPLVMDNKIMDDISADLGLDEWCWVRITKAEYETYRDLYGFHVITK